MGGRIRLYLAAVVFLAAMTNADQAAASLESPA
jgi:hypothetical protein